MTQSDKDHIRKHFPQRKQQKEKAIAPVPFPSPVTGIKEIKKMILQLPDSGRAKVVESEYRIYVEIIRAE
jgi:hypothetical protein